MGRGRFITFEGGEGVGKSTQVRLLAEWLRERGCEVLTTREPGGSPGAEIIREALLSGRTKHLGPMAEAILFSGARIDHIDSVIRPALEAGKWVLCDRFTDSMMAYQGAAGEPGEPVLRALERVVVGETRPHLTVMLDLPPEKGLERAAARRQERHEETDRFEGEALAFHQQLRERFQAIAAHDTARCAVVDADAEVDEVARRIRQVVETRLGGVLPQAAQEEPAEGLAATDAQP